MTRTNARIVVGIDGSEASKQALRWAASLAAGFGGYVDVVSAWHLPAGYGFAVIPPIELAEDIEKSATATVDEVFGPSRPADLRITVVQDSAAHVLIEASHHAAMIVVGSRGHGGFADLLLGSVSAAVVRHATCPVLVVHGDGTPLQAQ